MNEQLRQLKQELQLATRDVTDIEKRKRAASYKKLSQFSKNLIEQEHQAAVSKQFDVIEKITELVSSGAATMSDAEEVVKQGSKPI